jgi:hypothetical protein
MALSLIENSNQLKLVLSVKEFIGMRGGNQGYGVACRILNKNPETDFWNFQEVVLRNREDLIAEIQRLFDEFDKEILMAALSHGSKGCAE